MVTLLIFFHILPSFTFDTINLPNVSHTATTSKRFVPNSNKIECRLQRNSQQVYEETCFHINMFPFSNHRP